MINVIAGVPSKGYPLTKVFPKTNGQTKKFKKKLKSENSKKKLKLKKTTLNLNGLNKKNEK